MPHNIFTVHRAMISVLKNEEVSIKIKFKKAGAAQNSKDIEKLRKTH